MGEEADYLDSHSDEGEVWTEKVMREAATNPPKLSKGQRYRRNRKARKLRERRESEVTT